SGLLYGDGVTPDFEWAGHIFTSIVGGGNKLRSAVHISDTDRRRRNHGFAGVSYGSGYCARILLGPCRCRKSHDGKSSYECERHRTSHPFLQVRAKISIMVISAVESHARTPGGG